MKRLNPIVLFLAVALLTLSGNANAQSNGNYERTGAMTPRELMNVSRELEARYPMLAQNLLSPREYKTAGETNFSGSGTSTAPLAVLDHTLVYGSVMSANNWSVADPPQYRLCSMPLVAGAEMTPVTEDEVNANGGGVYVAETNTYNWFNFYSNVNGYNNSYYQMEMNELSSEWMGSASTRLISTDMAYDPTTGNVYGCFYNDTFSGFELGVINFANKTRTTFADLGGGRFVGLAVNNDGDLYGIHQNGNLYKINPADGTVQEIGSTGLAMTTYTQSAAFDPNTDKLYFSALLSDSEAGLYEIDTTTGHATLVTEYLNAEQFVGIFIPMAVASDDAPAMPTDLTVNFEGNSTVGTVTFTLPTESKGGEALSGSIDYVVKVKNTVVASGSGEPGQTITEENISADSGMNKFTVEPANAAGKGEPASLIMWIGFDEPLAVTDLSVNISYEGVAELSWTAPTTGSHGKPVASEDLTYNIVRHPDDVTVAEGLTETNYTDHIFADEMASYTYTVTPYNRGLKGASATTAPQIYGSHVLVPFEQEFTSKEDASLWTITDGNSDGSTWSYTKGALEFSTMYGNKTPDEWIISPAFKLSSTCIYKITFDVSASKLYQSGNDVYDILYGNGDVNEYTGVIAEGFSVKNSQRSTKELTFSVEENGDYSIAFHLKSVKGASYTSNFYNFKIEIEAYNEAPAAPELTVVAGERGANTATINVTAPTLTSVGNPLQEVTSVTVVRDGGVTVGTQTDIAPGQEVVFTDTDIASGNHTYEAYATNNCGDSPMASATAFIGLDKPSPSLNALLKETGEDEVTVTWTPSEVGVNGGYVNVNELTYRIQRSDAAVMNINQAGVTSFTDTPSGVRLNYRQSELFYNIFCSNENGESARATTNSIIIGESYQLPYVEAFSTGWTDNMGWTNVNTGKFRIESGLSSDGDNYAAMFTPSENVKSATYISSKIDITGATEPTVIFDYYAYPGTQASFSILAEMNQDGNAATLATIDFAELTGEEGWRKVAVPVEGMDAARYVRIHFVAESEDINTPVAVDNIVLRDYTPYNVAAKLDINGHVTAGQKNAALVKVENLGSQVAKNFTIELYVNDKVVDSKPSGELAVGESNIYELTYEPKLSETGVVRVHAYANYKYDSDLDDNMTDDVPVVVEYAHYPVVTLDGQPTAEGILLTWDAPELAKGAIVDDFETYVPWLKNNFGEWTTFDADGGGTWGLTGVNMDWNSKPMAWMTFNVDEIEAAIGHSDANPLTAHSGSQYVCSFASNYMDALYCQDWLISPEISTKGQTLTFWARQINSQNEAEWLEVKYSTTDNQPSSFTQSLLAEPITDLTNIWKEYSVELPAGAKFFALENVGLTSGNSKGYPFAIFVDDVEYTSVSNDLEVAGYNVYRNGELIAQLGADCTSYVDGDVEFDEENKYQVTVVYNLGESEYSNEFNGILTGIAHVSDNLKVASSDNVIIVRNAGNETVKVFAANGAIMYENISVNNADITVIPGVYLVKVGSKLVKMTVK